MTQDILTEVRRRLADDVGNLRAVAVVTGIPYDTILRIKNSEGDPGYSKVRTLGRHYGIFAPELAGTEKVA